MREGMVAYQGVVTLKKAVWDNIWGMWTQFQLEQRPQERNAANPFKRFTKMRKDRVGTRFSAVFSHVKEPDCVAYEGEVMLKGWSDGVTGWKVDLWVDDDNGLHPFMGHDNGDEYALVLVELDDDDAPIDQEKRKRVEEDQPKGGPLSQLAARWCHDDAFCDWLESDVGYDGDAKAWMLDKLKITSRAMIDHDEEVAARFHAEIRKPFAAWFAENRS